DGGIDARHPAFRDRHVENSGGPLSTTRVRATYDFTLLRDLLATGQLPSAPPWVARNAEIHQQRLGELNRRLESGDEIDWSIVAPLIEVPHLAALYVAPVIEHGTHVAGILGGCWPASENPEGTDLIGIARDIKLFDIRVFDNSGASSEDTIVH